MSLMNKCVAIFLCEGDFLNNSCKNKDDDTNNIKAAFDA